MIQKLLCWLGHHKASPILDPDEVRERIRVFTSGGQLVMVKCARCNALMAQP